MTRVEDVLAGWARPASRPQAPVQYRELKIIEPTLTEGSAEVVRALSESSGKRVDTPVRNSFVRSVDGQLPPLAALASRGGKGGSAVAMKLYLALIWRCSREPFVTQAPNRTWAQLLDLPDPSRRGARRVKDALATLHELGLVGLTPVRGLPTIVALLSEDGRGRAYTVPSDAYRQARSQRTRERHQYFKVPQPLWVSGHMQGLSAAGVVMLLILLEESREAGTAQWWSVDTFTRRFGVSKDVRARGTKELVARQLLTVRRMSLPPSPGTSNPFGQDLVRNTYELIGEATPT
ncbi:hypothetical protein ATK74_0769 [Propionicimonas paludicola]|uniref:Uncharacterized protein n=1 Tax=Propionicimonas paludicola TaxID=185243 RepID=A0A2A9CQ11_9ACTN|nr:hypothetical protein ATK74_0769 [Propionicimonas paludicola]